MKSNPLTQPDLARTPTPLPPGYGLSPGTGVFFPLFFLSGMCALIYEIAWTRRLTLIFGNTVYSVSTVLVAFMGGLALGSMLFGRFADKRDDPIRMYGWLEIGIGVSAVLIPLVLSTLTPVYRFLYNATEASNYALSLVRFFFSTAVLLVPTTLMGATLPVLSKFIVFHFRKTGFGIGSLYAVNTFGAVAGCFLAGFVLLGWIGISRSEHLAASINVLVGLVAFWLHRSHGHLPEVGQESHALKSPTDIARYTRGNLRFVLVAFGLSGMLALAYEVMWTRILVFLLGSSIYSFSMILVVYLLGLTAGSLLFARISDELKRPLEVFGWLELAIGLSALAGLLLFQKMPFQEYSLQLSPGNYLHTNFLSTFAVVLAPTLLMGATFPVAVRVYTQSLNTIGTETGSLYAVNTLGAIVGSFVAGFVLIPLLGSKNSVLLLVLLSFCVGLSLLILSIRREGAPVWNWAAASFLILPIAGFAFGNDMMRELSLRCLKNESGRVLAFKEDPTAAVAVVENANGMKILSVNGVSMTVLCSETQLMAHLPIALLDEPRTLLNICFGMGSTFVSARRAGLEVDLVELCPFVVEAFAYFQKDPEMLNEPGVRTIIADGRNYLLLSDKTYNVITVDPPPPPWSAGTVNLYTREFYALCKERLNPGGIVCQWLPTLLDCFTEDQFKMQVATFMDVFPHTTVWNSPNRIGAYLIGTQETLEIDDASFNEYFQREAVKKDLSLYSSTLIDGPRVLSLLLLEEDDAREYAEGAPIMSDDLPLIEFPLFRNGPDVQIMDIDFLAERGS